MRPIYTAMAVVAMLPGVAVSGPYEDCILQNMKGVTERAAAFAIREACEVKTTPKKCRGKLQSNSGVAELAAKVDKGKRQHPGTKNLLDKLDFSFDSQEVQAALRETCLKECSNSPWHSRTFGECSTD